MVSIPGYSYKPILSMVCWNIAHLKWKMGSNPQDMQLSKTGKKWIIVPIYLDAGTLQKPEFNWRSGLTVYLGVERILGAFFRSIFILKIL